MTFTAKLKNKEAYFENCLVLSPRYISNKKQVLKQFSKFCKEKYKESDEEILNDLMKQNQDERIINAIDVIQLFLNYLVKLTRPSTAIKLIRPSTARGYISTVNGYFNYRGIKLSSLDLKAIRYPREIKEEKYPLSKEEIKQILDNSSYRRKTLYFVLLSSGMRIGETIALRKKDFDISGKRIMINIPAIFTKTKKSRRTFVSLEAGPYLMKRLEEIEDNDLVFATNKNQSSVISEVTETKLFSQLIDKVFPNLERYESGTRRITLHSFRSFFITQAVRSVSDSFAHSLAGQEGYLKVYKRYDNEAMLEDYLKLEANLFIFNNYGVSDQTKDKKIEELESKVDKLAILFSTLKDERSEKRES